MQRIIESIQYGLPVNDEDFDAIYPHNIKELSKIHWTPLRVARMAADFLVSKPQTKVLDIGSGVAKFCIVGALTTEGLFFGVEQRKALVKISEKVIQEYKIENTTIIHSNITDTDFSQFDAFYFYNSFYENILSGHQIDLDVKGTIHKYKKYRDYLFHQLTNAPSGTRLVTYSGFDTEVPPCYAMKSVDASLDLKFWVKENTTYTNLLYHIN